MTHSVLSPFILIIATAGKTNTLLPQNLSTYAYKKMSHVPVRSNYLYNILKVKSAFHLSIALNGDIYVFGNLSFLYLILMCVTNELIYYCILS